MQKVQDNTIPDQGTSGSGEGQKEWVPNKSLQISNVKTMGGLANTTKSNDEAQLELLEETFIGEDQQRALKKK